MRARLVVILMTVQFSLSAQPRSDGVDDVLQHVPMAASLVLKSCGVKGSSPWPQYAFSALSSYAVGTAATWSLKHVIDERRPDDSDSRSFPSGHSMYAFAGATVLCHEYGGSMPWVAVAGYGVAVFTAADRVCRRRHYIHDVCAGAAIGVAATELSYLLRRTVFKSEKVQMSLSPSSLSLSLAL